jgi:LacI family transcriptional regulator
MEKKKHATLTEVARKAGVGTTTVSRVINGGDRVSPKTLASVLKVIETLGYTPNQAARTLKGHRTKTIGLVIPSIADPFFSSCAEAAQAVARANDSLLIVTTTQNDSRAEIASLDVLIRHRTDGLLIAPANSQGSALLHDLLKRVVIPVVAIDRPIFNSSIASVVADNFQGANIATRHLIEHGYKRIVCLTGESTLYTIRERIEGYREAIATAGLKCLIDTSVTDYRSTEDAIKSLLFNANPPDAIFALKNSTTIYAFEVLQKFNISVPDQIALLGFDDFELASTVRPSITVIQQPVEEMARLAAELLFNQLLPAGKGALHFRSEQTEPIKLETRLIRRSSCGCIPGAV